MDAPRTQPTARVRLDTLTSLRFFAAFAVFLSHSVGRVTAGPHQQVLDVIGPQGNTGVSFFFVLSGFVLMWSHRPDDTVPRFYRRRFARIAPAYWVCLVPGVVLLVGISGDLVGPVVNALPSALGLQAWVPVESVYYGGNAVGWSLSVEMFFYAVFPALVLLMRSRRGRWVAVAGAAALALTAPLALRPVGDAHDLGYWSVYLFPVTRLAEFVIGMLLAAAIRRGWRCPVPLPAAIAIALAAYVAAGTAPTWAAVVLVTLVPYALLIASAATADLTGRWGIRSPLAIRLGEWSFAFYLTHGMILIVTGAVLDRLAPGMLIELAALAAALGASVAAAGLLYVLVERPAEKRLRGAPVRPEMATAEAAEVTRP